MRANLHGDGFVAVLEQEQPNGVIDTIRIIAPSEPACREYITHLLSAIGTTFGSGSHADEAFRRSAPELAASFPCDVSHLSDQLRAMLRQPPERRPTVSVVGEEIGDSAILGGAIRFGADGPWQQLFPLGRNRAILSAAQDLRNHAHRLRAGGESLSEEDRDRERRAFPTSEEGRDQERQVFPAGDILSPEAAAQAIGVTRGTLRGYVRSGRVRANPDGTINTGELRSAGFVIRNS
jgi:hypothetical protein